MTPTVGRIVHFYIADHAKQFNGQGAGPYPAMITQVFPGSRYVNLKVFPGMGESYDAGSVAEGRTADDGGRYWVWPPRGDA